MKILKFFIFLGLIVSLNSCSSDWSVKRKKAFKQKCDNTVNITPYIYLEGFAKNEIQAVKIIEKLKSSKTNKFTLYPDNTRKDYGEFVLKNNRKFNIHNKYEFYVGSEKEAYVLSDMKMKVMPQRTMTSYNYACKLVSYKMNNENSRGSAILIHKRKSVFEKECSKVKTFNQKTKGQHYQHAIKLIGFDISDMKNIKLIEKSKAGDNTSFTIKVIKNRYNDYELYIEEDFNIDNKYEFYIGNDKKPYVLSDMKMEVIPRRLYTPYKYDCAMNKYKIDGQEFTKSLKITKRKNK